MSKVFRLYKNGDNTFTDWHESASFPYNSENRDGKNGIDELLVHLQRMRLPLFPLHLLELTW